MAVCVTLLHGHSHDEWLKPLGKIQRALLGTFRRAPTDTVKINYAASHELIVQAGGLAIPVSADLDSSTLDDRVIFAGNDTITGSTGNDYLLNTAGSDQIYGMGGTDTYVCSGTRSSYAITNVIPNSDPALTTFTLADQVGTDGTDQLHGIERLQFSDGTLALDTGVWQTAGEAYRLYRAAFARTPDNDGLKYWISQMDNGQTNEQVAHNFIVSAEFQSLYGSNPTHAQLVTALYQNVLDRAPDQGGFDYWKGLLDNNQITPEQILINFSESNENVTAVGTAIKDGIWLI